MNDHRLAAHGLVGYPPPVAVMNPPGPDTAVRADAVVITDTGLDPDHAVAVDEVFDGDSTETGDQLPEYMDTQHTGQRST